MTSHSTHVANPSTLPVDSGDMPFTKRIERLSQYMLDITEKRHSPAECQRVLLSIIGYEAFIGLSFNKKDRLWQVVFSTVSDIQENTKFKPEGSLIDEAYKTGAVQLCPGKPIQRRLPSFLAGRMIATAAALPVTVDNKTNDILLLLDTHPHSDETEDIPHLQIAANCIMAVRRHVLNEINQNRSENHLRLTLETSGMATWEWDLEHDKVRVSQLWIDILGFNPVTSEQYLRAFREMVYPDDYPAVKKAFYDHLAGDTSEYFAEYRILDVNEQVVWIESHGKVISRAPDGKALFMVGSDRPITQRKENEERIRRRDNILDVVAFIARSLLSSQSWETNIEEILCRLGEATGTTRVIILEYNPGAGGDITFNERFHWDSPTSNGMLVPSDFDVLQPNITEWIYRMQHGEIVLGNTKTFSDKERSFFAKRGILSSLCLPIIAGEQLWGVVAIEDKVHIRTWSSIEIESLKVAAEVLGAVIQQQKTTRLVQKLYEGEREQRRLAQVLREIGTSLSSTLNFDEILDRLLENLGRVVPYDAASVMFPKDGLARVARTRGYEQFGEETVRSVSQLNFEIEKTSNLSILMTTRQPLVIPDTLNDPNWIPTGNLYLRSWAGAPIVVDDQVVAIFSLDKTDPNFYGPQHAETLDIFASQAALAIHNARLFAETLEALEREQRLNEVTRAITSSLELQTVLERVVELAAELVGADSGSLALLSDDGQSLVYPFLHNLPDFLTSEVEPKGNGIAWRIIETGKSELTADYPKDPNAQMPWVKAGLTSLIAAPVRIGERNIGVLGLFALHGARQFTERDLATAESVARQTGVAIENARLLEAAKNRATEAQTLQQAVSAVNSDLDLNQMLDTLLFHLKRVVPYDSAAVFLVEEAMDALRLVAGRGFPYPNELTNQVFPASNPLFEELITTKQYILLADARKDQRFAGWGGVNYSRGWIGMPVIARGELIGVLTLDSRKEGAYSAEDAALCQAFASEVAIAIQNARLFQKIQKMAITDPLTNLYNRRYFFEHAEKELQRTLRYHSALSIIMIDIDHFKLVNDNYTHQAGDKVLIEVGQRIAVSLRSVDLLARYGGEEFILMLPQTPIKNAKVVAERICTAINSEPFLFEERQIAVTVSQGVAELDAFCTEIQQLIHRADQALYVTKTTGRGRVTVWTPEMDRPE